jgi:hypothetical protein
MSAMASPRQKSESLNIGHSCRNNPTLIAARIKPVDLKQFGRPVIESSSVVTDPPHRGHKITLLFFNFDV